MVVRVWGAGRMREGADSAALQAWLKVSCSAALPVHILGGISLPCTAAKCLHCWLAAHAAGLPVLSGCLGS